MQGRIKAFKNTFKCMLPSPFASVRLTGQSESACSFFSAKNCGQYFAESSATENMKVILDELQESRRKSIITWRNSTDGIRSIRYKSDSQGDVIAQVFQVTEHKQLFLE